MAGNIWVVSTLGGYMHADNLSKELRHAVQPLHKFRQFCDIKDAAHQGKSKGDTFHWDVYQNVATQGTSLTETNTMPETNFTITQGTLTITEYGNSVPYSGKLDALSEHPVKTIVNKVLKHDAVKAFDTAAHAEFDKTPLKVYASGTAAVTLTTNSTVGGSSAYDFGNEHAKAVVDIMKERNINPYEKDDYFAISWPTTLRGFKTDLEGVYKYVPEGFGQIRNGEVGRYENTRYVEQTNIAKAATTNTDWIFFMGEDTVAEAIAIPEEMRGKIPSDFGRSKGVAWYYLGGFGLCHTEHAQARIVKWESNA